MRTRKQDSDATTMTSTTSHTSHTVVGGRNPQRNPQRSALFQKSTRKNQEFERFLCNGQEAAVLDATTSKYIPLSYFVTPHTTASPHPNPYTTTSSEASAVGGRTSSRHAHGLADKMPFESFRLINLQQRGNHAHSLVLFKSRAITTNPEQIAIFECNGQYVQSEIRVIHTYHPDADADDEPGTVYDVTENYFSPISPKVCMNYGNDRYNPGYCGIFGMIAMIFFRGGYRPPTAGTSFDKGAASCPGEVVGGEDLPTAEGERWIRKWTQLLKYMRQDIPDEPESHGCMGTNLAARVQEIIAAHPSTATGHQNAEKEINALLKQARKTFKQTNK